MSVDRAGEDRLVFIVRKGTACAECDGEIGAGQIIGLDEKKGALCLTCADMDHLEFLTSGNAALTRRTVKHSRLHAKVLRWSHTRKRYERQGVLVESQALGRAEQECLSDEDFREARSAREAEKRAVVDRQYVDQFAERLKECYPSCPADVAEHIAQHACLKYSGRVGRSAAAKVFDPEAIRLAVRAYIRHNHTRYDEFMAQGSDRSEARAAVADDIERVACEWQRSLLATTIG